MWRVGRKLIGWLSLLVGIPPLLCEVPPMELLPATTAAEPSRPAKEGHATAAGQPPGKLPAQIAEAVGLFNRGAACMEQYSYAEAAKAFAGVLAVAPQWTAARYNLGLAYFNLHGAAGAEANLQLAKNAFEHVLAEQPDHIHARFCLGLYYQHLGQTEEALACFQEVCRRDPEDPYLNYKLAEVLIAAGKNQQGTEALERVIALDPGFISAYYRLAMQYVRSGQREKATALLKRFQALKTAELTGGTFTVDRVYGSAGKYYTALGADSLPLPSRDDRPHRPVRFSPQPKLLDAQTEAWPWGGGTVRLPGIAAGDVDADGDLDLCITGMGQRGQTVLWLGDGSGGFSAAAELADRGVSPCFGDVDNDGDLDLWLGRAGTDMLLYNDGKGRFSWQVSVSSSSEAPRFSEHAAAGSAATPASADAAAHTAGSPTDPLTGCAPLADLDSDGDLDLLAFRLAAGCVPAVEGAKPAAGSVYNNNRDGSFRELAAELGLALPEVAIVAAVYDDFDNDRDLDLILLPAGDRVPLAWVNDRVGKFRILEAAATGLTLPGCFSGTSGDPDKDGDRDLLLFTRRGPQLLLNQGRFRFKPNAGFSRRFGNCGGTGGQFADMDNDGDLDLLIPDAQRKDGGRGPLLLINDWPQGRFLDLQQLDPGNLLTALQTTGNASCVVADFTGDGRCDVLWAATGQRPLLMENITQGGHFIAIDCRGTRPENHRARSNSTAIGARVEVKTGAVFQQHTVGVPCSPVALPPARLHFGLGSNVKVDWLRILWPDGVLQAELEVAADRVVTITETQRKESSCPLLFAWTGERFEFVADFGGVGGLGYLLAPGQYARADPTEYLTLPRLKRRGDHYVLQALSAMEEVTYFDEAKLLAVDHPAGTEIWPHEMMAVSVPPPAFEIFCVSRAIRPLRAVDHRGVDVTQQLAAVDRCYAGAASPDPRFPGLAERHYVELDFGDRLRELSPQRRWILVLRGWVDYGYSSTNYAAAQAELRAEAPSIAVFRQGRWVELFHEVGYPAGINHVMTLEVTGKLRPHDRWIRITSNMELYWDQILLAEHLGAEQLSIKEVAADSADLHFSGYPREYSPDGRLPNLYDYDNRDRAAAWELIEGHYTRYGEVGPLLAEADDRFVIMGHGEELTLRFPADPFGPLPPGKQRTFVLKTDSYCKDMDLYTAHPDTVEPLPFHAMSRYPYGPDEKYPDHPAAKQYQSQYNTRTVRSRRPGLPQLSESRSP